MATFNPETDCILLVDGVHGVHVLAMFCGHYTTELEAQGLGACAQDIIEADRATDVQWPEEYPEDAAACADLAQRASEAWDEILDNAVLEINGARWTLYQDQDLWAIREGVELPEQW